MKRPSPSTSRRNVGMVLAAVLLTCMAIGTACSDQGEGDRCESQNGNADCKAGLVCWEAVKISQPVDRCCPEQLSQATALGCKSSGGGTDSGSGPQPDSSTTPTPDAETDSGSDAETDSGSDGSIEDASDQ